MRVPSPRQPRLKHSRARFVAYTEREWGEIKSALQYLGKDADAITVRVGTMDTEEIKSAIAAIRVAKERGESIDAHLLKIKQMGPHYYWGSLRTYLELHGQLATPPSPTRALSLSKRGANRLKRVLAALSDVADQVPDIVDSIKSKIEAAENLSKYNAQKPGQACFLQLLHDLWTFRLGGERAPDNS